VRELVWVEVPARYPTFRATALGLDYEVSGDSTGWIWGRSDGRGGYRPAENAEAAKAAAQADYAARIMAAIEVTP